MTLGIAYPCNRRGMVFDHSIPEQKLIQEEADQEAGPF